jgi:hypothetical protein
MRDYIIAHQDKLTDLNDGGILTSQVEAFSRELAMLYVSCRVGFSSFLRELPYSVFGFTRKNGERASTQVVFSRAAPLSSSTSIPAGIVVSGGGFDFVTTGSGKIDADETNSQPITAIAQEPGDKYNVGAKTIKTIISSVPPDIISVDNPQKAAGGTNTEDWAAYIDRFADYITGLQRTNTCGLTSGLWHLIRSKAVEEHFPPLDGIWNMTLYLEDGSGGIAPKALAEAKSIIDGDIIAGKGGYRAPGINIRYMPPEIVPITTEIIVEPDQTVSSEFDHAVVTEQVLTEVRKYIDGLKIGESLLKSDLIVVLKRLPSVHNIKIPEPVEDVLIQHNQIVRYESCIVTAEAT